MQYQVLSKLLLKIINELIFYIRTKSFLVLIATVNFNFVTKLCINPTRTFQALSLLHKTAGVALARAAFVIPVQGSGGALVTGAVEDHWE